MESYFLASADAEISSKFLSTLHTSYLKGRQQLEKQFHEYILSCSEIFSNGVFVVMITGIRSQDSVRLKKHIDILLLLESAYGSLDFILRFFLAKSYLELSRPSITKNIEVQIERLENAVSVYQKMLASEDPSESATGLMNLGFLYHIIGHCYQNKDYEDIANENFIKAAEYHKKTLKIMEDPEVLGDLGYIHDHFVQFNKKRGKLDEAHKNYCDSIRFLEQSDMVILLRQ